MKLYYTPGACSLAAHIALEEAGLQYDLERVDLATHKTEKGEDYYGINPKGYVPALRLDDGSLLTEVGVVLQYIADKAPEKKLAPAYGTMERYRLMEWLTFISSEVHKGYSPLFNPAFPADAAKAQLAKIGGRYELLNKTLEKSQFLMGDQFSIADIYLYVPLLWSMGKGPDIKNLSNLSAYFGRIAERPTVKKVLVDEGLAKA